MSSRKRLVCVQYESVPNTASITTGPIPSVNGFHGRWFRDPRKCERRNHIPNLTPTNSNRDKWTFAYDAQLRQMLNIVASAIDEECPKSKIKWDMNPDIEKNFSEVIYYCSSKYISPYLEDSSSKNVVDYDKWEEFQ